MWRVEKKLWEKKSGKEKADERLSKQGDGKKRGLNGEQIGTKIGVKVERE